MKKKMIIKIGENMLGKIWMDLINNNNNLK